MLSPPDLSEMRTAPHVAQSFKTAPAALD